MRKRIRSSFAALLAGALFFSSLAGIGLVRPTTASAALTWSITAYGNGHGLGLSQNGAQGMAKAGKSYSSIITTYYRDVSMANSYNNRSVPWMNVAVSSASRANWTVATPGANVTFKATASGSTKTFPAGRYTAYFTNRVATIKNTNTGATVGSMSLGSGMLVASSSNGIIVLGETSGPQSKNYVAYQGDLRFYPSTSASNTTYKAKNRIAMEAYLMGVIPREMPASWETEALKAQAVAARSYALAVGFSNPKTDTDSKLVSPTTSFQVYNGYGYWDQNLSHQPVQHDGAYRSKVSAVQQATNGKVATYNGSVITAYFSADAGGYTENSENVWSGVVPYIRGIKEPNPIVGSSSKTFSATQLVSALNGAWGSKVPLTTKLISITVSKTGFSPRPVELTVKSSNNGTIRLSGNSAINTFCRSKLGFNSTYIKITNPAAPSSGKISRIGGATRYDNSQMLTQRAFSSSKEAIIASGTAPFDALAASGLASVLNGGSGAPVLLTTPTALSAQVKSELVRLGVEKVYIVGGPASVTQKVLTQLASISALSKPRSIERLGGATRFEVAEAINKKMKTIGGSTVGTKAIVVNGAATFDALGSAGYSYAKKIPIVLVQPSSIPAATARTFAALGTKTSLAVGGSASVTNALIAKLPGGRRLIDGATRYEITANMAKYLVANEGFSYSTVYVTSSTTEADALAAGALMGKQKAPLLLTYATSSVPATDAVLSANRSVIKSLVIVGGTGSVAPAAQASLDANLL